jgi:integrase
MARHLNRLTATFVRTIKTPGWYPDGGGLYLQVGKGCARSWIFRYALHGCKRKMGLGSVETIGLSEAQELARQCRQQINNGIDPIQARDKKLRAERLAAAKQITFGQAHEQWKETQTWFQSTTYREIWLYRHYRAALENVPISEVNLDLIEHAIKPAWNRYPRSGIYILQHMFKIIEWARAKEQFIGDNPANPRGPIRYRLKQHHYKVRNHPAMPWRDIPAFIARLRAQLGGHNSDGGGSGYGRYERPLPTYLAEFQILTAVRPSEARLMQWPEINWTEKTWTVPPETTDNNGRLWRRLKRDVPHVVFLSEPAMRVLEALRDKQMAEGKLREFVFSHGLSLIAGPGYHPCAAWARQRDSMYGDSEFKYGGKVIACNTTLAYLRDAMSVGPITMHGFRASFKRWAIETGKNELASEGALHHAVGDVSRNAYARGAQPTHLIRMLMDAWGAFCDRIEPPPAETADDAELARSEHTVIPIRIRKTG